MFATNANFQIDPCGATIFDRQVHQPAYTIPVQSLEGILGQDPFLNVFDQEVPLGIVPAVAKSHLGKVIGAKREEFSHFADLYGGDTGTRDFDHRAKFVLEGSLFSRPSLLLQFVPGEAGSTQAL